MEGDKGDDTYSSLKVINESVREEFDSVCIDGYLKELDMLHAKLKTEGRLNSMEWWSAKKIAEHMEAVMDVAVQTHGKPFDVFRHEYRPGCYDDFGVTHFYDAGSVAKARKSGDKIKLWCVVMDMHS